MMTLKGMTRILMALGTTTILGCHHQGPRAPQIPKASLSIKAYPRIAIKPCQVTFFIKLSERTAATDCAAIETNWGDGSRSLRQNFGCYGLPLAWTEAHYYRYYGSFKPAIYLRSQENGSIIEWAETSVDIVYHSENGE